MTNNKFILSEKCKLANGTVSETKAGSISLTGFLIIIYIFVFNNYLTYAQTPQIFGNFPVRYDNHGGNAYADGLPIVADFKGDGQKEIAVGSDCQGCGSKMFLIDINGNILPGWPRTFFNSVGTPRWILATAAGDLLGNGRIDLVVKNADSIYAVDYLGNNLPGFPVSFTGIYGGESAFSLCLYDLENNGSLNIVSASNNRIAVFNKDGTYKTGWPKTIAANSAFVGNITCGDIVGDHKGQIVAEAAGIYDTTDANFIYAFDRNGNNLPGWPVHSDSLYNFNGDAAVVLQPDTLTPANSHLYYCTSFYDTGSYVRTRINTSDTHGNIIRRWYYYDQGGTLGAPLVADILQDGSYELFTGEQGAYQYLYTITGSLLPGWPQLGSDEWEDQSCIGKIKYGSQLFVISPEQMEWFDSTHTLRGWLHGYGYSGNEAAGWPLRPLYGVGGLTFYDVNFDGSVELLISGSGGSNYSDTAALNVYTIPGIPFTKENFPWPMFGHDRYRSNQLGFVPPDEPNGIKAISHNIPGKFALYQNYPNPFNPTTTIKFAVPFKLNVILKIYDVAGREVKHTDFAELQSGEYSIEWDAVNNASGVYIYRIEATSALHNYADVKKMVLLK